MVTALLAAVTVRKEEPLEAAGQLSARLASEGRLDLAVKQGLPVTARTVTVRWLGFARPCVA